MNLDGFGSSRIDRKSVNLFAHKRASIYASSTHKSTGKLISKLTRTFQTGRKRPSG